MRRGRKPLSTSEYTRERRKYNEVYRDHIKPGSDSVVIGDDRDSNKNFKKEVRYYAGRKS